MLAAISFSSQGKTARAKPSAQLDLLPSSSETDHHCSRSVFAALGSCPRHKKVPPLHPADVTRMVLDPILSVYRKGISWHRMFPAANKNEPQARYALKGSFVTSVGFGAERPGGYGGWGWLPS